LKAYAAAAALLLMIFGGIGLYLYNKFSAFASMDFTPPPVSVSIGTVERATWSRYLDAVGTIRSARGIELSAETSGDITELLFASGDRVEQGQLLLVLNDQVEQAARRNQIASLELAQILFERDAQLVKQNSIPETQFDRSKADLERARAQLAETEARIRQKRIIAPFAGTLGIRQVNLGDYLSAGTTITTLQDLNDLDIDFNLPGRVAPLLRVGMPIKVQVDAFPQRSFAAEIRALDSRIDLDSRNILVRARLLETAGLLPGMFGRVRVELASDQAVLTVAETAVSYSVNGNVLYRVLQPDEAGAAPTVESVVVETGDVRDGQIAVSGDVAAGDTVVINGQNKLYRGARIAPAGNAEL
ncbi:MAG: efflux RND transporter periplasmic adaptor subunit, partial [Pseudomonadota bacterium]